MNRLAGIAVVGLVVLVVLMALYAGGFLLWVRPHRIVHPSQKVVYSLEESAASHALEVIYRPVFYFEGSTVQHWSIAR